MTKPTCATCRWWDPHDTDEPKRVKIGYCCRFPPVFQGVLLRVHSGEADAEWYSTYFPSTDDEQWCGEHQPKPNDNTASQGLGGP